MRPGHWARCFGLDWHSDIALDHFDLADGPKGADRVTISRATSVDLGALVSHVGRAEIDRDGFRFSWNDEVVFGMRGPNRIDWCTGPRWTGAFPPSFFSSVAALALALRGSLPLHASSVVLDGKAWLVAGRAGEGKSTLVAELLSAGGQLLADDLTALAYRGTDLVAVRGRPAMRLHPDSAARVDHDRLEDVPDDPRGKLLVWPKARAADTVWPIAGALIVRGEACEPISPVKAAAVFGSMLFRPKILAKLPGHAGRRAMLLDLARHVPLFRFPSLQGFDERAREDRLDRAVNLVRRGSC